MAGAVQWVASPGGAASRVRVTTASTTALDSGGMRDGRVLSCQRPSTPSRTHGRPFPTALDPLYCNRYEIGAFAKEAYGLGIHYLGVCCGASPMLIREVAEAVGRTTEASRYSEKMANHFLYGTNERIADHIRALGDRA
jgi:betaine-homocysteine S-methyltransferase